MNTRRASGSPPISLLCCRAVGDGVHKLSGYVSNVANLTEVAGGDLAADINSTVFNGCVSLPCCCSQNATSWLVLGQLQKRISADCAPLPLELGTLPEAACWLWGSFGLQLHSRTWLATCCTDQGPSFYGLRCWWLAATVQAQQATCLPQACRHGAALTAAQVYFQP